MSKVRDRKIFSLFCVAIFAWACLATLLAGLYWTHFLVMLAVFSILLGSMTLVASLFFTDIKTLLAGMTAVAFCLSIFTTNWPIETAFAMARPDFEKGIEDENLPGFYGPYRIVKQETRRGIPCYWTDADPAGPSGFVNCDDPGRNFNLWYSIHVVDSWHFVVID